MRYFVAFLLFVFPTGLVKWLINLLGGSRYHIGKNVKIGFSLILADKINIAEKGRIGHLDFILVRDLSIGRNSRINHLNTIKGNFDVVLGDIVTINKQNKIANSLKEERRTFRMDYHARIQVAHVLDVTESIWMKDNAILAGYGSQIWTHSFQLDKEGVGEVKKKGKVIIGKNVYVGARSLICPGVEIADASAIGAGCVVSKPLSEAALYVNQPLRKIDFRE